MLTTQHSKLNDAFLFVLIRRSKGTQAKRDLIENGWYVTAFLMAISVNRQFLAHTLRGHDVALTTNLERSDFQVREDSNI